MNATPAQIAALRSSAATHGDLEQEALCVLALGGREAIADGEPGTEHDRLYRRGTTQDEACTLCERAIADAAAMASDSDDEE